MSKLNNKKENELKIHNSKVFFKTTLITYAVTLLAFAYGWFSQRHCTAIICLDAAVYGLVYSVLVFIVSVFIGFLNLVAEKAFNKIIPYILCTIGLALSIVYIFVILK